MPPGIVPTVQEGRSFTSCCSDCCCELIVVDSTKEWEWPLDLLIFLFNVQIGLLDPRVPQKSPGRILQVGVLYSPSLQIAPHLPCWPCLWDSLFLWPGIGTCSITGFELWRHPWAFAILERWKTQGEYPFLWTPVLWGNTNSPPSALLNGGRHRSGTEILAAS